MKLSELGESGLIKLFSKDLIMNPAGVIKGIGDDTAVLQFSEKEWLLFTTDMLVEDIHFSLSYSTFFQIGSRTVVANVSDIAAMGGQPTHAVISLAIPPRFSVEDLVELYNGLRYTAREYNVNIVGGDTVKSPERFIINMALLGVVEAGRAVYRDGARPGDLIFVTGSLGASAAGLYLCQHPETKASPECSTFVRKAYLEPRARLATGRRLGTSGKVTAMDDISDGLARELHEVCLASGVGCRIKVASIPIDWRVREVASAAGYDPLEWALSGGEEFELLFTVSPANASVAEGYHLIGEILPAEKGMILEFPDGCLLPLEPKGYDHFSK